MKISFKALFILATIFCIGLEEFVIEEAQAGILVRVPRSRYRRRVKKSTFAAKKTKARFNGENFGVKKSIGKVYASRLKAYKVAVKNWQKEKKLALKLEKEYTKLKEKQQKADAKARIEMAKRLAKQKEKQRIVLAEAEAEQAAKEVETGEDGEKKATKGKSFFSKFSDKADSSKPSVGTGKTGFKKDKLKFMSRLFLSLFGKE